MPKSIFASKTVWFNTLTILVAVASQYGWTPNQDLTHTVAAFLVALSPFANLALRFFTKKPISLPK